MYKLTPPPTQFPWPPPCGNKWMLSKVISTTNLCVHPCAPSTNILFMNHKLCWQLFNIYYFPVCEVIHFVWLCFSLIYICPTLIFSHPPPPQLRQWWLEDKSVVSLFDWIGFFILLCVHDSNFCFYSFLCTNTTLCGLIDWFVSWLIC